MLRIIAGLFFAFVLLVFISANTSAPFYGQWIQHIPFADKIGHFILVGMVAFFVNLLLNCKRFRFGGAQLLLGSAVVVLFFTLEEASQYFIPVRTCEVLDLLCNYLGIFVFGKLALWFNTRNTETSFYKWNIK